MLRAWPAWAAAFVASCVSLPAPAAETAKLSQRGGTVEVTIGGRHFATYNLAGPQGEILAKPYLYPVRASDGTLVTADQALSRGDHPHHRSLWVGHGEVNGANHWENAYAREGGPVQRPLGQPVIIRDTLSHQIGWEGRGGKMALREARTLRFFEYGDGARGIDLMSTYTCENEMVVLGDTKEAGMCALRVAKAISDDPTLANSAGMRGEKACWGKPAEWCGISGRIGKGLYGVAVLDHPENPRHPSRWHVREYGLLAANVFGLSVFERGKAARSGRMTLRPGQILGFHYRIVVHAGDCEEAKLDEKFSQFAGEPGPGIEHIFNGKDLSGWNVPKPNPWWSAVNGELVGTDDPEHKGSVLETRERYGDLIMETEFKFSGDADSGIFLRRGKQWQCQIGVSRSLKRDMTCSIYSSLDSGYPHRAEGAAEFLRPGKWNKVRILARGPRFRIWLNGRLVLDCTDERFPEPGPIGLQLHGNVPGMRVAFRNIRARALEEERGI